MKKSEYYIKNINMFLHLKMLGRFLARFNTSCYYQLRLFPLQLA